MTRRLCCQAQIWGLLLTLTVAARAQSIAMSGTVAYELLSSSAILSVQRIDNYRAFGTVSGTLALELWAASAPYSGLGDLVGFRLTRVELGTLNGGNYAQNVQGGGSLVAPPAGVYNLVMVLAEWSSGAFRVVDWHNFSGLVPFGIVPPIITQQPASRTVTAGNAVSFSVGVSGTAPFAFQWYHDNTPISGANASTLLISSAQLSDAGGYWVHVVNPAGSADSTVATLTVEQPPIITQQPQAMLVVNVGGNYTLRVEATGFPALAYQWYRYGFTIAGATNSSLIRSDVRASDQGTFTVTVKNSRGTVTSQPAVVLLNSPPTVSLTTPTNGATLVAPGPVALAATAADTLGTIARVEFYSGGTLLGISATSPYSFTWISVPPGSHTLTALAVDSYGAAATSAMVAITVEPPVVCVPPLAGMVLWWPGEGSGQDLVGSKPGVVGRGTWFAEGKVGQAFDFDGVNGFVKANGVATTTANNWAMTAWIYWKGVVGSATKEKQTLLYNGHEGGHGYGLIIPEQGLCSAVPDLCSEVGKLVALYAGVAYFKTGVTLDQNAWNHLALVRENGVLKLYRIGVLAFSQTTANPFAPSPADGYVTVGSLAGYAIKGSVDEVMFFNRAITAEEVRVLVAADGAGVCRPEVALSLTTSFDGALRLKVNGQAGVPATVYASPDLRAWLPVTNVVVPALDVELPNTGSGFYKALVGADVPPGAP